MQPSTKPVNYRDTTRRGVARGEAEYSAPPFDSLLSALALNTLDRNVGGGRY